MSRDIAIAICRAAARGEGIRLTAEEVYDMAFDSGIRAAAYNILSDEEKAAVEGVAHPFGYRNIKTEARG